MSSGNILNVEQAVTVLAQAFGIEQTELEELAESLDVGQFRALAQFSLLAAKVAARTEGLEGTLRIVVKRRVNDMPEVIWTPGKCHIVQD